jgi:hypothetical protein
LKRVIAVEVFGCASEYDPQTDPVVRIETSRLRTRLAEYYEISGAPEPLRIAP